PALCNIAAEPGHVFTGLTDNGVDVSDEVIGGVYGIGNVREAHELHAVFEPQRAAVTLSKLEAIDGMVTSVPAGIACGAGCAGQVLDVPHGSMVELLATAGPGVEFMGWGGGVCAGAANPCAFPVVVVAHPNPSVQAQFGHYILASVPAGYGVLGVVDTVSTAVCGICTV